MTTLDTLDEQQSLTLQSVDQLALSYTGAQQLILHLQSIYQNLLAREESLTQLVSTIDPLARDIKVSSPDDYARAATFIVERINPALKEVDTTYADLIALAYKVWKTLLARKAVKSAPLEEDKMLVEVESLKWCKEENARVAEKARLDQMERERIAREQQILRQRESRAQEISVLIQQGNAAAASDAMTRMMNGDLGPLPKLEVAPVAPSYQPPIAPKVAGVALKTYWHFRVTNRLEIKPDYLIPDEKLIKSIVDKRKKDAEGIVGGIEVWSDEGMATKGRK